jgi:hypothetical protein
MREKYAETEVETRERAMDTVQGDWIRGCVARNSKEETGRDGSLPSFLHCHSKECGNQCYLVSGSVAKNYKLIKMMDACKSSVDQTGKKCTLLVWYNSFLLPLPSSF